MNSTQKVKNQWLKAAQDLQIEVKFDVALDINGKSILAPVLVKEFGRSLGMIVVESTSDLLDLTEELINYGYGYSVQPYHEGEEYERNEFIDMLSDWGWMGTKSAPEWYSALDD